MARIKLTADELELIQERRKRNALFNEGVLAAADVTTRWLDKASVGAELPFDLNDEIKKLLRE